jgi:hypothetical protein
MHAGSRWKVSNVSFVLNLLYELTIALIFENFCQGTIGEYLGTNSTLGCPCPMWVIKYDGSKIESKVSFVAPNSLLEYQVDDVTGVETLEGHMSCWRRVGEHFTPPEVAAAAAAGQESAKTQAAQAIDTMSKILKNCAANPGEDKYRKIKFSNPKIAGMLSVEDVEAAMLSLGWVEEEEGGGGGGPCLVLPVGVVLSTSDIDSVIAKLKSKS